MCHHAVVRSPLNASGRCVWCAVFQRAVGNDARKRPSDSAVAAIHLYHCIAFSLRASAEEIFQHLAFVSILCGLAIPFKWIGGVANNFGCFFKFLSGLPGGVDYVMLTCVAQGGWTS